MREGAEGRKVSLRDIKNALLERASIGLGRCFRNLIFHHVPPFAGDLSRERTYQDTVVPLTTF